MIALMILLPSLQVLLENRPVLWLYAFITSSKYRVSDNLYQLRSLSNYLDALVLYTHMYVLVLLL